MANPEEEFKPGDNRFEAELSHALYDAGENDWDEVVAELDSEAQEALDGLLKSGVLTDEKRILYTNKLDQVVEIANAAGEFDQKARVLKTIDNLKVKLAI